MASFNFTPLWELQATHYIHKHKLEAEERRKKKEEEKHKKNKKKQYGK